MASTARRLLHAPGSLFHGNAFHPHGLSLAFSETLLVPTLLGFPGFVAGNPVLTYNLLVLLFWPVNGVAMAWAAHELPSSDRRRGGHACGDRASSYSARAVSAICCVCSRECSATRRARNSTDIGPSSGCRP